MLDKFTSPIIIPTAQGFDSLLGWNPPPSAQVDPFFSQQANQPYLQNFSSSEFSGPAFSSQTSTGAEQVFGSAVQDLSLGNIVDAGEKFRKARTEHEFEFMQEGKNPDLYVSATIGEATWYAKPDDVTYRALDRVLEHAKKTDNIELQLHERIVRANLVRRLGGSIDTSYDLLHEVTSSELKLNDPSQRALHVQAQLGKIDLCLQEGLSSKQLRPYAFQRTLRLLGELRDIVDQNRTAADSSELRLVAGLHLTAGEIFLKNGYPLYARQILEVISDKYSGVGGVNMRALRETPFKHFINEDGSLVDLKSISIEDATYAAVKESFANAVFSSRYEFWRYASAGSIVGTVAAMTLGSGGDFSTALFGSALGATTFVASGKAYKGITSNEALQAFSTGHSDTKVLKHILARTLELGMTYAFFGGVLPGVGELVDVPLLNHLVAASNGSTGQLVGPGAALGGLTYLTGNEIALAGQYISANGFSSGMGDYWNDRATTTVLGSSLNSGVRLASKVSRYVANDMASDIAEALKQMANDPLSAQSALRLYKAGAVGWAGATMVRPELREWMLQHNPKALRAMEVAMLPASYLFGVDVGLTTGVNPFDAYVISGIGMGSQVIVHGMGGGKISNLDLTNVMRNAMVPALYAGTGAQLVGAVEAKTLLDHFANSMGVQVGFIPIGFAHGLLLKFPLMRFWQNKAGRSFSAETIGNIGSLMMGYSTWYGSLFREVMQQLVQCPWMSKVWQEPVAGAPQRAAFRGTARPVVAEGKTSVELAKEKLAAARSLEDMGKVAGRRWRFMMPLTGNTVVSTLPMFVAYPMTLMNKDEPFATIPEEKFYGMIYKELSRKDKNAMPSEYVEQYLENLHHMTMDLSPSRRDVRRNMLVATYAAREGRNGEAIKQFFAERDWLFDHYGVDRNMGTPPEGSFVKRWNQAKWFRQQLQGSSPS